MNRFLPIFLALSLLGPLAAEISEMQAQLMRPCLKVETDVGDNADERKAKAKFYAQNIADTSSFFLKVFNIEPELFVEYATRRNSPESPYDTEIRIRIFRRYDEFLADFQKRYRTETIPGAFFGIIQHEDEYGDKGAWFREIGAHAEGATDEQVLRHLYHELGHLFMRTYMFWPVEVPSWIEEGTAELFQYRERNGTHPEAERQERLGWLAEMVQLEDGTLGAAIDWKEFTGVRNAHNLAFTHENPLRSAVQYVQCWSVMEFMIDSPQRGRAFTKLLQMIKSTSEAANLEAQRQGKKGEAFLKHINDAVYNQQYELFKKAYGRDVLGVEEIWKDWVTKTCEKRQKREPELYYHRGVWHLHYRARFARDAAGKQACLAQAEALFQAGIAAAPDCPENHVGMGRLAMMRGDLAGAGDCFAKAAALGTDNFEALLYGGIAALHGGRAVEAIEPLRRAAAQRPTHFDANLMLGNALAAGGGDAAEAQRHLAIAADIKPEERARAALIAGVVAYNQGDYRDAHIQFLRAAQGLGQDPRPVVMDAIALLANVETEQAQQMLTAAAQAGNRIAARMLELQKTAWRPRLGFDDQGRPGIVGITVKEPAEPEAP